MTLAWRGSCSRRSIDCLELPMPLTGRLPHTVAASYHTHRGARARGVWRACGTYRCFSSLGGVNLRLQLGDRLREVPLDDHRLPCVLKGDRRSLLYRLVGAAYPHRRDGGGCRHRLARPPQRKISAVTMRRLELLHRVKSLRSGSPTARHLRARMPVPDSRHLRAAGARINTTREPPSQNPHLSSRILRASAQPLVHAMSGPRRNFLLWGLREPSCGAAVLIAPKLSQMRPSFHRRTVEKCIRSTLSAHRETAAEGLNTAPMQDLSAGGPQGSGMKWPSQWRQKYTKGKRANRCSVRGKLDFARF